VHVLQIVSARQMNGVIAHLRLLIPALRARGHRVSVVARQGSPFVDEFGAIPSDLHRCPADELRHIAQFCLDHDVEVIHAHMSRANNFATRLSGLTGLPCVLTAHALVWHPHWPQANRVIAVSESTARWHRRWNRVAPGRIETVLNFVDPARLVPDPAARQRLRAEWGATDTELLFGTVGDIIPRKGHDVLIPALEQAPGFRLVVVGKGDEKFVQPLKKRAGSRAIWLGTRPDIPEVLSALDGFVLASRRDPCPMAVIEAMAAGLPVVGSRVDGIPEFVEEGQSGFLARPADPIDLARALRCLVALTPEARRGMGNHCRTFIQTHATPEVQVPKIEAVLLSIAGPGRTGRLSAAGG
jgi:L-malate glycosyltransferase